MALMGQGDARWLVEERKDGTNVNGWHWVERDAMEWSKARLGELLVGKELLNKADMSLTLTSLESVTGEAVINNRKQKIIPSYELEIKLVWEGAVGEDAAKGKLHIPYISEENHDEEPELRFALEKDDAASTALKAAFLQGEGKKTIVSLLHTFVAELRAGGPALTQAPSSSSPSTQGTEAPPKPKLTSADPDEVRRNVASANSGGGGGGAPSSASPSSASGAGIGGSGGQAKKKEGKGSKASKARSSLELKENFFCKASDIMECFLVTGKCRAYTQSEATIEPVVGGKFTWFGGSVQGEFTEILPSQKIVMKWRFNSWEDGVSSMVVMDFSEPEPGHTVLVLSQTNIPEADKFNNEDVLENVEKGWRLQIFNRIRQIFGYGLGL